MRTGTLTIAGKQYTAAVDDAGKQTIDGMTVEEFYQHLLSNGDFDAILDLVEIGRAEKLPGGSAQAAAHLLHAARTKRN